jgi:tetratricopeptide (TPR) repeat protein
MKNRTFNYFVSFLLAGLFLVSCGSIKKMADTANQVKYNVTPKPLEMHVEKVAMSLSGTFPAKYFIKKAVLVITPVLKAKDGTTEKAYKSFTLQGEGVKDNNKVIKFKEGGAFSFSDTIPYEDGLRFSDLELRIKASAGSESVNFITVKVAEGVITTPRLVDKGMEVDNGGDGKGQGNKMGKLMKTSVTVDAVQTVKQDATIFYELMKSDVRRTEMDKKEIKDMVENIKNLSTDKDKKFSGVQVSAYASPEGPLDMNARLVKERGTSSMDYLSKELKKLKVDALKDPNFITKQTTPDEDWEGFQRVAQASSFRDKDLVLRVLSMYSDPVVREKEIKNIAEAYTDLKESVLPKLRRAIVQISYEGKAKTDDEMVNLAVTNPSALKDKELFHAAEITKDANQKVQIYTTYTNTYPNDWKGFVNLGVAYADQGKLAEAKSAFEKAKAIDSKNSAVLNNLGVVAFAQGNMKEAEQYFTQAKANGASDEIGYNLGVIKIKQGKYRDAVSSFGSPASFNKALAQTLATDNGGAKGTLNAMGEKEAGIFYYLKAIVAAKNASDDEVIKNLTTAVSKDASLKDYAKKDMEFGKYLENAAFKALVQ